MGPVSPDQGSLAQKDLGPTKPIGEPGNLSEAGETSKQMVKAAKEGRWWYFSALGLMIIMFALKFVGAEGRMGFWPKLGRWRYILSPALSLGAALLAAFEGGVSLEAAFAVFTSSYATSSLQELWEHGLLGKPRASAKKV